ncbi:hypothetical protein JY651_38855 [Pyxidicoccus parkwayensis]|uniref:Lipoprotein n=1 Tax=Pyxidicoccus parkwayensis TaxID=2813578 RepID=A0ABX7NUP4_9BACT|nr:hypothetical protein [Pyxidicoccus parkwaysis]QSQ21109.1 hypothetical protein JY651_38855 [Pyxidicoccus parkwaysis]
MHHDTRRPLSSLLLAGSLLLSAGCSKEPSASAPPSSGESRTLTHQSRRESLDKLPETEPERVTSRFIQRLESSAGLDEDSVVLVKLPPPKNKELADSLVRVVGEPDDARLLVRSDALKELGILSDSLGEDTFGLLGQFDGAEVERRQEAEEVLASGKFGETTEKAIIFEGRTPVALSRGVAFDRKSFESGLPVGLNLCPLLPVSTEQAWGQSLFITAKEVVQDESRTWDPCTDKGKQGGVWTFAHLMREAAAASGYTAEEFVLSWLSLWLNDVTVNGDRVEARVAMFDEVIVPWARASGANAVLVDGKYGREVSIDGPLDLDEAPFRLLAIVNRLDLGGVGRGLGGYGGGTTGAPTDAGELRFVFGLVQPALKGERTEATCKLKRFTLNLEYGVPVTGCARVAKWAREWTQLNTFPGFTTEYLEHLQGLTDEVIRSGAAPERGNESALKQLRTNENALVDSTPGDGWEMREFTLTDEKPERGTDVPSDGLLRPHTVAQTPDDAQYPSTGNSATDAFVVGAVRTGIAAPFGPLPDRCRSSYSVPYAFQGQPFRGGHSHMSPYAWESWVIDPAQPRDVCARHDFSLNTCNGCHSGETDTFFSHVDPESGIPAQLSRFLTGGGPGGFHESPDWQNVAPRWRYADLERRFQRLYAIAWCTSCVRMPVFHPELLPKLQDVLGVVPIDPLGLPEKPSLKVGPIRELEQVKQVLEIRRDLLSGFRDEPVDAIRQAESFVH